MPFWRRAGVAAPGTEPGEERAHWRAGLAAFALAALATVAIVTLLATMVTERDRAAFEAAAQHAQDAVIDRLDTSIALLRGTAGLFAAHHEEVTVESFREYVARLALAEQYPGLLGIGFSRRVLPVELEAVQAEAQRQHGEFRIWPGHLRDEYHAILFLEPLDARNRAAIGFDMHTEALRRAAMDRARDEGQAAASAVLELVQEIEARKQPGFLIYLPVYRGGAVPASVPERRERLLGFAYSPIRAVDFLSPAFSHEDEPTVWLQVYHGTEPRPAALLYERGAMPGDTRFERRRSIDVAGEPWTFVVRSRSLALAALALPAVVALAGLVLALLLALLVSRDSRARAQVRRVLASERQARAEAEAANAMKDDFLATLSHELRTPLNAILGWTAMLARPGLTEEQRRKGVEVVDRNARAQARLIEDLLDMNRIASGKLHLEMHPVELAGIVADAVRALAPGAGAKDVRIEIKVGPGAHTVRGDPARLLQVVSNLLSNAIKFTPRGGHVGVSLGRSGPLACISVADTGEGIDPALLERIFDRFAQADASTTRRHGGLGLGLAIVRQLVELHGGRVRAESEGRGHGARFVVELPLVDAPPLAPAAAAEPAAGDVLDGLRVLVVDDDPDARELIRVALAERGAEVRLAASAREALDALRGAPADVLLSDIGMPEMDGYELIREVRALPPERGGRTPAAAITAYAREADREQALDAGFQAHFVKPIRIEPLVAMVARLAGRAG